MKKQALKKDFFMEIRKSLGRFLSIFFIVAMGVAFFSGIRASEPDMRLSGDAYFDRNKFMDIQVISTLGITDKDVKAIENVKGVERAIPGYSTDVLIDVGGNQKILHVSSILEDMNLYVPVEGTLPKHQGECFLDQDFAANAGLKVGDTITLISGDENPITDLFKKKEYRIVGLGNSASYIEFERGSSNIGNGEVSGFLALLPEDFSMDAYTECCVEVEGARELTAFTPAYDDKVQEVLRNIEDIGDYQGKLRADEVRKDAKEELLDAQKDLEQGKKDADLELKDALLQIQSGEKELNDGKNKIENAKKDLIEGKNQLYTSQKEVNDAYARIANEEKKLESGKEELKKQERILKEKEAEFSKQYQDGMAQIQAGEAEIKKQEEYFLIQYEHGLAMIEEGEARARTEISGKWEELKKQKDVYKQGIVILQATKEQLDNLQAQIEGGMVPPGQLPNIQMQIASLQKEIQTKEVELQKMKEGLDQEEQMLVVYEQEVEAKLSVVREEFNRKIESGKKQLTEETTKARQQLTNAYAQLENGKTQIETARQQIVAAKDEISFGETQLIDGRKKAEQGQQQIDQGLEEVRALEQELKDSEIEISKNEKKLADAKKEYEEGKKEAEEKIQDGEQEFKDAKADIAKIEDGKWYVNDRSITTGYTGYGDNADRMRAIGEVFPILFFIVAALISLTTMTRMVEEQRTQIGTLKALGYGKMSIAWKYLSYALLATIGGSVFGVLFGEKVFPYIIVTAYKIMYTHIPDVVIPYHAGFGVMATVTAVLCTSGAALLACYKELASQPAVLMRPPAPKQGKRVLLEYVPFIWKHLSFIWKSTIRNLIRYKKRFFMTVFGIGGCMALMIVGFGLRDSIFSVGTIQYDELQVYDGMIILNTDASDKEQEELERYLEQEKEIDSISKGYLKKNKVGKGNIQREIYLYSPVDLEKNKDFLIYRNRKTHETYELGEEDAILTEKIAKEFGVKKGDTVFVDNKNGEPVEITITNICENYMEHYLYLSPKLYEKVFKEPVEENNIFFKMKKFNEKKLGIIGEHILEKKAALNVSYTFNMEERLDEMLESLDIVIVVLIVSAGLLAFVVLYNLNNINITERKRELATIKVLGFYDSEVSAYVYRENILLTIIGTFAGVILGSLLHRYVITTVEIDSVMFTRIIENISFVYSALLTFAFSVFVNMVMYFKLKKIDMVESLKSVE